MVERIVEIINSNGIAATSTQVNKNGIILDGITFGNETVRPTLYVQDFNGTAEEIAMSMIERYNSLDTNQGKQYSSIGELVNNWDWVKDRLYASLMKSEVDGLVMKPYLDLNIYYRIMIDDEASIKVTKQLLSLWNITEDDLYSVAMNNTKSTVVAMDLMSMLMRMDTDYFESDDMEAPMVVITNKLKVNGAIAMATDIVGRIAEKMNTDVYILPSSIHECIVVPATMDVNEVTEMVMSVNSTEVDPIEQLSNHAYIYRRNIGEVECA